MLNKTEPQRPGDFHFKNVCIVFVQEKASDGLEEVRLKPWAKPLSSALRAGAFAAKNLEGFVPGASILEGALSFGASILNPETTLEDLQKGLVEVKEGCEGTQAALKRLLLREKERAIAFANTEAEMRDN